MTYRFYKHFISSLNVLKKALNKKSHEMNANMNQFIEIQWNKQVILN